jgi:hypothetical protein
MKTIKYQFVNLAAILSVLCALLVPAGAQQSRSRLGEQKSQAVDAMLGYLFPGSTPFWDVYIYIQGSDGTRTRLAITNVAQISNGSSLEFVTALQDFKAGDQGISLLEHGKLPPDNGSHANLLTVSKDTSGVFSLIATVTLETSHIFSTVTDLNASSGNLKGIVISYETIDLAGDKAVETTWYAALSDDLQFIQKYPVGVTIKGTGQSGELRVLQISRTPTEIIIRNPESGNQTSVACSKICEPTVQQFLALQ